MGRSTAFYRDVLGLPFLFSAGPALAFLDVGGVRLMLAAPEGEFKPGLSSVLYFKVADIDAAFAALSARGVTFSGAPHFLAAMPDHDLWLCEFRDPDQIRLYTIATIAVVLMFGAWSGMEAPRIEAGLATPWVGVEERIFRYAYQLWFLVLAVTLLREQTGAGHVD